MKLVGIVFGAKAQVVVGLLTMLAGFAFWAYIEMRYAAQIRAEPLQAAIFRVSMFFGEVACYSILSNGLTFRGVERVETAVVENIEHADEVDVRGG